MKKETIKYIKFNPAYQDNSDIIDMCKSLYDHYSSDKIPGLIEQKLHKLNNTIIRHEGFIALLNGKPVGYCAWEYLDDSKYIPKSIFISELYVKQDYRRLGIGSKLVKKMLKVLQKDNTIWLTHNPQEKYLTEFYKSLGFEKYGVTDVNNVILIKKQQLDSDTF